MRSSTWRALGNTYRRRRAGRARASTRSRASRARAGDGRRSSRCLGRTATAVVEIAIWNPDGSLAELSGNGTRIAAAWLAARIGRPGGRPSRSATASRTRASSSDGRIEQELGRRRRSARPETVDGVTVRAGLGRQPACGRRRRSARHHRARAAARDARALPGSHERAGRARRRPGRGHRARLGARRGGDPLVGDERRRGRRGDARRGRRRSSTSRAATSASASRTGARRSTAPPSASPELRLRRAPRAGRPDRGGTQTGPTDSRAAPPRTAWPARRESVSTSRRGPSTESAKWSSFGGPSVHPGRALVNEDLRVSGGEDRAARPLGDTGREPTSVTVERAGRGDVVGEQRDLRDGPSCRDLELAEDVVQRRLEVRRLAARARRSARTGSS